MIKKYIYINVKPSAKTSKQNITTAAKWHEASLFTLKNTVSTKNNHRELHKANIQERAATAKLQFFSVALVHFSDQKLNLKNCLFNLHII